MLFTSLSFWIFLCTIWLVYSIVPRSFKKIVLFIAGNVFLAFANWESLALLYAVTLLSFYSALEIKKYADKKMANYIFGLSIAALILTLGIFKYLGLLDAIISSIYAIMNNGNRSFSLFNFQLLLPLGISFYIFQALGYLISVKRGVIDAENRILDFASYLFFFPKLLSGPIERAENFIPQLKDAKQFNYSDISNGGKLIILGLFKKLVIADRISVYVNAVYGNFEHHSSLTIALTAVLYVIQVYSDFSGYTDIARGVARLFGYSLMENFERPLFAQNISGFWRRWHISLSTWAMDYIYYPIVITYRDWGNLSVLLATFLTFLIIGVWHGPTINFVLFGFSQMIFVFYDFRAKKLKKSIINYLKNSILLKLYFLFSWIITIFLITLSMILFRFTNIDDIVNVFHRLFLANGSLFIGTQSFFIYSVLGVLSIIIIDIWKEFYPKTYLFENNRFFLIRQLPYLTMVILVLLIGVFDGGEFIYVQF
jgi:alginate O-acetyltransferase complex protein AlgI